MGLSVVSFDTREGALLRVQARLVSAFDVEQVAALSVVMLAELAELSAVGLAAPQIGVPLAFFVYRVGPAEGLVVNPVRKVRSGLVRRDEMCLSLPGVEARPLRPGRVVVEASTITDGRLVPQLFDLSGFVAQVFDHEIDHLEGVSMLERVRPPDAR